MITTAMSTTSVPASASTSAASPVFCWICQEEQAPWRTTSLSSCGHRFCVSCLSSHLTMQLLTSETVTVTTCCYRLNGSDGPCGVAIGEVDTQRLLAPEIWRLVLNRNGVSSSSANQTEDVSFDAEDTLSSPGCDCRRRGSVPLTTLTSCGHVVCVPCASSLVTYSILQGHTSWTCTSRSRDLLAPRPSLPRASKSCGSPIADEDIRQFLCPYMWAKHRWLWLLKSTPGDRICGFETFLAVTKLVPEPPASHLEISESSEDDASSVSSISVLDAMIYIEHPHASEFIPWETFLCQVCMEAQPIALKVDLRGCGHSFCRHCIANFLTTGIRGGRVDFSCFYLVEGEGPSSSRLCAAPISSSEIEAIVPPASWTKYARFALFKSSDLARECPFCQTAQVPITSPENLNCVCSSCGQIFCLQHSNAHPPGESCADYEKRQPRLEKRSKVQVKRISKPCPGCERPIERAGGCMHMTCSVCNANFCWLCCEAWTNSYTHFDPFESNGCRYTYKHRIEAFSSECRLVRGIAHVVFYTTMAILGVPAAIVFTICRVPLCKTTPVTVGVMVVRVVAIFSTAFILRTAVVVGVVMGAFFGCVGEFSQIMCARCCRRDRSKHTETWLPVTTPHFRAVAEVQLTTT